MLQHQPDSNDVVLRPAPIAFALQISQDKIDIEPARNARRRACDLPRHKIFAAPRGLVIIKNTVANKHSVRLPVDLRQLRRERFRAAVGTRRAHRRFFCLRRFRRVPENFRSRRMIKFHTRRLIPDDLE